MKYDWNPEKNEWLKEDGKISFEQVVFHLSQGDVWKVADHPDQQRYPGQKIYFVLIEDYIYLVPHSIQKEYIFLKTIIPSRKATIAYQREQGGGRMKYDEEEKNIIDAYESGEMKLSTPSKEELESIKVIAKNTFKKDKRITIRLYDHDYKGIQKKALEMGIPYQTLISSIIHSYIEGDLISRIR